MIFLGQKKSVTGKLPKIIKKSTEAIQLIAAAYIIKMLCSEASLEPSQTSTVEFFVKIVNGF